MYPIPTLSILSQERIHRPFIQGHVAEALSCALETPSYAAPNLSKWFRKNRTLGSRDRRIVSEIVYTIIRFERWFVKAQLTDGIFGQNPDFTDIFDWWINSNEQPQFDFGTHLSIPDSMANEWLNQLQSPVDFAHHMQRRAPIDLRVNASRTSRKKISRKLTQQGISNEPIANTSYGLRLKGTHNIQQIGIYKQGLVEIQDTASQLFIEEISSWITPKTTILDLCAGAGGKSLALAALGAQVYVHEPRSNALKELRRRGKRSGASIIERIPENPVDMVIVDAPCSGSGRLRREPTLRWKWNEQPLSRWSPIQRDILHNAIQYVKPSGLIAYATCSLMQLENQHHLDGWIANRTTIWGHIHNCDGFSWTIYKQESK